jgi:hypothetical protein
MTKAEWLACADPVQMANWARQRLGMRQLRLYAVASCRRAWDLLPDDRCRAAVEAAEAWADRRLDWATVGARRDEADACFQEFDPIAPEHRPQRQLVWAARLAASRTRVDLTRAAYYVGEALAPDTLRPIQDRLQADLLRDVAGGLFELLPSVRPWQTRDVVALARGIYEERSFGQMRVLADALEDAGCSNLVLLEHCRASHEHVRGCWCLDLVIGRRRVPSLWSSS